jgi:hypothetical protein
MDYEVEEEVGSGGMEEGYEEDGGEEEQMDMDDVPVTQEDAWAVIR